MEVLGDQKQITETKSIPGFYVTQKGSYLKRDQHPSRKLGIGQGQFIKKISKCKHLLNM